MNKDGIFFLLGSRPIDPKQRIRIFIHRDETEVSKLLRKFKEDEVFLGCVVCISTVCIKWVSWKYTLVGKRCLNLNRKANYRPQGAFTDRTEEGTACPLHFEIGGTCTPCFSNWGYKPIFGGTHLVQWLHMCKPKPVERNEMDFFYSHFPNVSWRVHYSFCAFPSILGCFWPPMRFPVQFALVNFFQFWSSAIPWFGPFSL